MHLRFRAERLTREEVATCARVSRDTVDKARKSGALESAKVGRRVLIPRASVERWLDGVATPPSPKETAAQGR